MDFTKQRQLLQAHTQDIRSVFQNTSTVKPKTMLALSISEVRLDITPSVVLYDQGSRVQVVVLAALITEKCPSANTGLSYYYK